MSKSTGFSVKKKWTNDQNTKTHPDEDGSNYHYYQSGLNKVYADGYSWFRNEYPIDTPKRVARDPLNSTLLCTTYKWADGSTKMRGVA